jgi:hypothetical protein
MDSRFRAKAGIKGKCAFRPVLLHDCEAFSRRESASVSCEISSFCANSRREPFLPPNRSSSLSGDNHPDHRKKGKV